MKWVTIGALFIGLACGLIFIAQGPALLIKRHTYKSKADYRKDRDAALTQQRTQIDAVVKLMAYAFSIALVPVMVAWFLVDPFLVRIELMASILGLFSLAVGLLTMLRGIR